MSHGAPVPARPGPSDRVLIEVPRWFAALADRGVQAIVLLIGAALGGFVALGLSWSGLAARLDVGLQVPFLVSGAFGGVALAGTALGIAGAQLDRRHNAVDRFYMDDIVRDVAVLSDALPALVATRQRERAAADPDAAASGSAAAGCEPETATVVGRLSTRLVSNGRTVHDPDCRMARGKELPPLQGPITEDLKVCRICEPSADA